MFRYDSPLFRLLVRIFDIAVLNLLWCICSLPVITIGASTCAMYAVFFKMREQKDYSVFLQFFLAFKENFLQSLVPTLFFLLFGAVVAVDFNIIFVLKLSNSWPMKALFFLILAVFASCASWLFPLIAKFTETPGRFIKNALFMTLRHPIAGILITGLNLLPWVLMVLMPEFALGEMLFVWVFFGFSLIAFVNSRMIYNVFYQYFPEEYKERLKLTE